MNLYDILACPMCKGAVVRHDHTLVCAQCQRAYPILNGIPVLLPEGSTPAPYDHALTVRTSYDPWLPRIVLQSLTADAISLEIGAGNMALSVPNIIRMDITLTPYVDVVGDAHALPFLPNTFSFVFSSAVIEHLRQPFVAAQEMHAILRNGGYVYGECSFVFPYHSHPFHYFNASYKGMEELFQAFTCIRSGVGPHQGPSFAIEALLRTYLYFLEPYNDPDVRPLKDLLQQVLAQPLRQHDLRFSQEAALQCAACIYFFGVKSPHASAVIPAALQSLHAQHPELQQRFADFFDLGIADNILAWAQTADRQRYSELAAYFDAIVPFRKDGTTEDQSPHPLYQ
ncbi:MAG: methyltransferase domain-containing protein, partial [Candidatus Binatia bacterium]